MVTFRNHVSVCKPHHVWLHHLVGLQYTKFCYARLFGYVVAQIYM